MVPVTTVSSQTRSFNTKNGSDLTGTGRGNQSLESRALDQAGAGSAKVLVDHSDVAEPQLPGTICQVVLATLTLLVVLHLTSGRLKDVDEGSPPKVLIIQF